MKTFPIWIIVLLCSLILGSGLSIYIIRFHDGLAYDQTTFSEFGGYISPFLTLISIMLLGYISFKANKISESFNQRQLQPQLFLKLQESKFVEEQEDWTIYNGFEASAVNIFVRIKLERDGAFSKWVHCFSLERNSSQRLIWLRYADMIEVIWTDASTQHCFNMSYQDWIGKIKTDIDLKTYNEVITSATTEEVFVNDLLSRRFIKTFSGENPLKLDIVNYSKFLTDLKVVNTDAK